MLALYVVSSELENKEAVRHEVAAVTAGFPIVEFVSNILEAEAAVAVHRDVTDGSVILVASGGTEAIINQIVFQTAKPALVWANPENNSLAAALEAYAALKARFPLKIVYSSLDAGQAAAGLESFDHTAAAIASIDRGVVGCLGAPSPWLLTSHGVQSFRSFKTRVVSLKLDRLLERYDLVPAEAAERVVAALRAKAAAVDSREQDLINSARLYLAMKDLAEEHNLTALT
ncbi:MAG: hypothetical protein MUE60_04165, partial [Candidatus Eisenbacteria bacterium]|nr:hypothetical protein [Candidatus Eisenbacteria bacterium]